MGLFDKFKNKKKKVPVTVMGLSSMAADSDERYRKQAKRNQEREQKKTEQLRFEPHSTAELRGYIEKKYNTTELERSDERYQRAYMGVKAHLVFRDAPELLTTGELPYPEHPPVSEHDPDYEAYRANSDARWNEAVMLPQEKFPVHLHVYNIPIIINEIPIAWLEVYVETDHKYLAFKVIALEYEEHYSIDRIRKDIIDYFGISEQDRDEKNERYLQYLNVQ